MTTEQKKISDAGSKTMTPYDEFNLPIPKGFPDRGMSARAAAALVKSECWTDANPMLNLSSFVTTFMEPEAMEIFKDGSFRNFADPDMYPHTKETEDCGSSKNPLVLRCHCLVLSNVRRSYCQSASVSVLPSSKYWIWDGLSGCVTRTLLGKRPDICV